jgi:hypothetical protein
VFATTLVGGGDNAGVGMQQCLSVCDNAGGWWQVVAQISSRLGVPRNFMFIACPGDKFPHDIGDFGGVRMITH